MLMSCGYFFYDFIACYYYDLLDKGTIIHHTIAVISLLSPCVTKYAASCAVSKNIYYFFLIKF